MLYRMMTPKGKLLLLCLMVELLNSVVSDPCSFEVQNNCSCTSTLSLININCSFGQLTNQTTPLISSELNQTLIIQELNLSHNNLTELPTDFFQSVHSVLSLDLSHNSFSAMPLLLRNITILNLSNNQINTLDSKALSENSPVRVLDLSRNLINKIEVDNTQTLQLHILNLSYNAITTVPDIVWMAADSLDLGYNQISTLSHMPESLMKYLTLSGNRLDTIPANTFSQLHFLDELSLDNNKIRSITASSFYGAWALTELDLSENFISDLDDGQFKTLPNLITLKLGRNKIQHVRRENFHGIQSNLQRLTLTENNLSNISNRVFEDLENLRYLDLSNNPSVGDVNKIRFPAHLASLDISNCSVQMIDDCKFALYMDLQFLGLSNNNLTCSCHLSWLYSWQKHSRLDKYFSNDRKLPHWKCFDSERNLIDVSSNQTGCANNTEHKKHCEKQNDIIINPDLVSIDLTVTVSNEAITAVWSMTTDYQIHGILVTYKTKDNTNFESPLLLSTATSYVIRDMSMKGSYTVCIHALFNETHTIKKECKIQEEDFVQMIIGILAGIIFIIPCIAALVYILYKDYKVMSWQKYQYLDDDVENSKASPHDNSAKEKTGEVKVIGEVIKVSETAKVKDTLQDSKEITPASVKVEISAQKTSEKADLAGHSHSNEAFESDCGHSQGDSTECDEKENVQTKL